MIDKSFDSGIGLAYCLFAVSKRVGLDEVE